MTANEASYAVIGAAIDIHRAIGPGLLESVYERLLVYELRVRGLHVQEHVPVPLVYKGVFLEAGYRIDLLVEQKLIVEIKAVENLAPVHFAQPLTYLRLSGHKLDLLINFNTPTLKNDIHRIINSHSSPPFVPLSSSRPLRVPLCVFA